MQSKTCVSTVGLIRTVSRLNPSRVMKRAHRTPTRYTKDKEHTGRRSDRARSPSQHVTREELLPTIKRKLPPSSRAPFVVDCGGLLGTDPTLGKAEVGHSERNPSLRMPPMVSFSRSPHCVFRYCSMCSWNITPNQCRPFIVFDFSFGPDYLLRKCKAFGGWVEIGASAADRTIQYSSSSFITVESPRDIHGKFEKQSGKIRGYDTVINVSGRRDQWDSLRESLPVAPQGRGTVGVTHGVISS